MTIHAYPSTEAPGEAITFGGEGKSYIPRNGDDLVVDPKIFGEGRQQDASLCLYYCSTAFIKLTAGIYEGTLKADPAQFSSELGAPVSSGESARNHFQHKKTQDDIIRLSITPNMSYSQANNYIRGNSSFHEAVTIQESLTQWSEIPNRIRDSLGKEYAVEGVSLSEVAYKMIGEGFISVVAYGGHARLVIGVSGKEDLILWDPVKGLDRVSTNIKLDIIAMGKSLKSVSGAQSIEKNSPGDIQWG